MKISTNVFHIYEFVNSSTESQDCGAVVTEILLWTTVDSSGLSAFLILFS